MRDTFPSFPTLLRSSEQPLPDGWLHLFHPSPPTPLCFSDFFFAAGTIAEIVVGDLHNSVKAGDEIQHHMDMANSWQIPIKGC